MNNPLVSVLMTVYNREKYIAEAIESVMGSSYQNWELIIVDDQSRDRSVEIAQSYAAKDARIQVHVNEVNLGDYPIRNRAASYAKGKYLKYLDSDDLIYPHGLAVMVEAMERYPDAGLGMQGHKSNFMLSYPFIVSSEEVYKQQFLGTGLLFSGPTGTIVRHDVFKEYRGLCETRYTGDFDSWLAFSSKHPVVVFQPALIWWRQHEGQEYQLGQDPSRYLKSTTEISIRRILADESPLSSSDRQLAISCLKQRQSRMFYSKLLRLKFSYAFKYFKYSCIDLAGLWHGLFKAITYFDLDKELLKRRE